jgi:hypothetical protein
VTIVKLAGTARGGGAEFVAAADMTFAAIGRAGLGQMEVLAGIVPGGGGTQYPLERAGRVGEPVRPARRGEAAPRRTRGRRSDPRRRAAPGAPAARDGRRWK